MGSVEMEKQTKNLEYRQRLDEALSSANLVSRESVKSLVRKQIIESSFEKIRGDVEFITETRTKEVYNFLEMLRSASGDSLKSHGTEHRDWKLKQDNEQLRVMYREGPQGSLFHTLLAEGYTEGPIDACVCVSWESNLYNKWWPQFSFPAFKVIKSTCLQKVRIGEEISLVRVKVPWPVSCREVILHYFELDYFEEDLMIILLNSISDVEHIDIKTHGFSGDVIPKEKDIVRMGLIGGFALQKIDSHKTYYRTIVNLDIKLDFVPPSLINFVSRQLIGHGFKLYQKAVSSAFSGDEVFSKVLEEGPMYIRIRDALIFNKTDATQTQKLDSSKDETFSQTPINEVITETTLKDQLLDQSGNNEITEDEGSYSSFKSGNHSMDIALASSNDEKELISPEVKRALMMLDKSIAYVRSLRPADNEQGEKCHSLTSLDSSNFNAKKGEKMDKSVEANKSYNHHTDRFTCGKDCGQEEKSSTLLKSDFSPLNNAQECISHNRIINGDANIEKIVVPYGFYEAHNEVDLIPRDNKLGSSKGHEVECKAATNKKGKKIKKKPFCLSLKHIL